MRSRPAVGSRARHGGPGGGRGCRQIADRTSGGVRSVSARVVHHGGVSTTFHSVDPRSGEQGRAFQEATPEAVRAAVAAAEAVHRSGALGGVERRAALLEAAARRLRAAGDEIVAVAVPETGLPEARLRSELERTAGQLEAFAAVVRAGDHVEAIIDTPDPAATPIPRPDIRRMLVPIGPVAVFGAS